MLWSGTICAFLVEGIYHREQFCEIILNLYQWFSRCCLKIFLIRRSGGPSVQQSRNHLCNLVEGIKRNDSVKFFEFGQVVQEEMLFKDISYLELRQPFCSAERNG